VTIPRLDPATVGLDRPWDSDVTKALRLLGSQAPRLSDPKASSGIENGEVGPELAGDVADELLMQAIPDGPGQNHKSLFELARRVRGLEEAAGGKYSLAALRAAIKTWCALNPHLGDVQMEVDYMAEFMDAYQGVRVPAGSEPTLDAAWRVALEAAPVPEAAEYGEALGMLAAWCRELQRTAGSRAFYLGSRTVADRFDLAVPMLAWRRLRLLCTIGVLELVEPGRAGLRGEAAKFRYRLPLGE